MHINIPLEIGQGGRGEGGGVQKVREAAQRGARRVAIDEGRYVTSRVDGLIISASLSFISLTAPQWKR